MAHHALLLSALLPINHSTPGQFELRFCYKILRARGPLYEDKKRTCYRKESIEKAASIKMGDVWELVLGVAEGGSSLGGQIW